MPIAVNDVKLWATNKGIGHAVAYTKDCYVGTACNSFANYTRTENRPKRICKKCRDALRRMMPIEKK